jgi:hypothetical protein
MIITHIVVFNFLTGASPVTGVAAAPPLLMLMGVGQ